MTKLYVILSGLVLAAMLAGSTWTVHSAPQIAKSCGTHCAVRDVNWSS